MSSSLNSILKPIIATAILGLAGMKVVIAFAGIAVCLYFRHDKHI